MEMISDTTLPAKLRAAACVLTRQLYVQSPSRKLRDTVQSVWDWDALQAGTLHAACLSLPPQIVAAEDYDGSTSDTTPAVGQRGSDRGSGRCGFAAAAGGSDSSSRPTSFRGGNGVGGRATSDERDESCAVSKEQMGRLQAFVRDYLVNDAERCMQNKELELLGGVLDVCLHLLRHGHMLDQGVVERIFERVVTTLGVPLLKPSGGDDDDEQMRTFRLGLECKDLICLLLEVILDFRLRLRVAGVLRSISQATTPRSPSRWSSIATFSTPSSSRAVSAHGSRVPSPDIHPRSPSKGGLLPPTTSLSPFEELSTSFSRRLSSTFSRLSTAAYGTWERLADDSDATGEVHSRSKSSRRRGEVDEEAARPLPLVSTHATQCNVVGAAVAGSGGGSGREAKCSPLKSAGSPSLGASRHQPKAAQKPSGLTYGGDILESMAETADGDAGTDANAVDDGNGGGGSSAGVDIFRELNRGSELLPWQRACEKMVRALVQTATEARGSRPDLVADALRVLFLQFNQARKLSSAMAAVVVVKQGGAPIIAYDEEDDEENHPHISAAASPHATPSAALSERSEAVHVGKTVRMLEHVVMGLKTLASTDPQLAAASILDNLGTAVEELHALCRTRHQRRVQCSFGAHDAVLNAIQVLQQVEGEDNSDEPQIVDGVYRLPPDELAAAREGCFDFLADFCGGGKRRADSDAAKADESALAEAGENLYTHRIDRSFSMRRNTYGGVELPDEEAREEVEEKAAAAGHRAEDEEEELDAANQEAIFPHFDVILDHMCRVRKATTCAQRMLAANPTNCGSVTEAHLDKLVAVMVESSARYAWYMDVLLALARGISDVGSTLPAKIMCRLLAAPSGYLLVLYSGTAGREKRARELAGLSEAQRYGDTGMVAFHHGLVQLLAELSSGLANEVEMYVQSIVPLHEACAHLCDSFCPYAIRASFFVLLMEGYTITALKVSSLAHSPAVWQVVALFVSELRSLLECIAGHGDEDDVAQAILAIQPSNRGPSFLEAGLWFCVAFLQKHIVSTSLMDDHRACLAAMGHLCSRILHIETARARERREREQRGHAARMSKRMSELAPSKFGNLASALFAKRAAEGASPAVGSTGSTGAAGAAPAAPAAPGDDDTAARMAVEADEIGPAARKLLCVGPHQLTLLSAVVGAIEAKGIGAGKSMWRNLGLSLGLSPVAKSVQFSLDMSARPPPPVSPPKSPDASGLSAHARLRRAKLSDLQDEGGGAPCSQGADGSSSSAGNTGSAGSGGAAGSAPRVLIDRTDGGVDISQKMAAAVAAVQPRLDAWAAQEFENSMRIFKESDEAIRPLIDQLKSESAASAQMQEHCLRVLQALLRAEPALQNSLDRKGVTAVMVRTLAAPSTPQSFDAALELGIALLDGGNRQTQTTVYATLSSGGSNAPLAALAQAFNGQCRKIETLFMEQKQQAWYNSVLSPHLHIAAASRPLRRNEDANRHRGGALIRGSSAALSKAVSDAQEATRAEARAEAQAVAEAEAGSDADASGAGGGALSGGALSSSGGGSGGGGTIVPAKKAELVDPSLANQVLLLVECMCECQYGVMKNFIRSQTMMRTQVNLLLDLVSNLLVLEKTLSSLTITLTCQLYQTLIELIQGPCPANQRLLIGTNLCDVAVRFMHGSYPQCDEADVTALKLLCLKLLLAMVEGVETDMIPRRIASSLDYAKLVHEVAACQSPHPTLPYPTLPYPTSLLPVPIIDSSHTPITCTLCHHNPTPLFCLHHLLPPSPVATSAGPRVRSLWWRRRRALLDDRPAAGDARARLLFLPSGLHPQQALPLSAWPDDSWRLPS